MKKLISAAAVFAIVLASVSPAAFAATASSGAISASASVDGTLSLTVALKQNSSTGSTLTAMNFGRLQPNPFDSGATLVSAPTGTGSNGTGSVVAMITANSHGLPYTIKQTGTALSNGTTTLPNGSLQVTPVYAPEDNGGLTKPAAATVGTAGTWVATDKVLYTSETGIAAMRTIQAHYGIVAGTAGAILASQSAGTYSGTVTITVTA